MKSWLLLLALTGCYKRDLADCAVSCATSADCPSGLSCTAAGLCAGNAATACGGDVDAPPGDGGDGPPPTSVQVLVLDDRGLPATGVRVIASSFADGSLFDDVMTQSDGTAILEAPGDVDVTAVTTNGVGSRLTTIRAIAPGTSVTFGRRRNEPATVSRTITWNTDPNAVGSYFINTSCSDTGVSVPVQAGATQSKVIQLDPTCADDFDVMVVFGNGAFQSFFQAATGNTGDVTLTGAFALFTQSDANFTQLPADVAVNAIGFTGNSVFRAADPARGPSFLNPVAGGGSGASAFITLPSSGSVGREVNVKLRHDADTNRIQEIAERIPAQGQYNLAIEPQMLPWIELSPALDVNTREIHWIERSAGPSARTAGDLVMAEITYERGSLDFQWRIILPPSAVEIFEGNGRIMPLPDLPGDETFELRTGDTVGALGVRIYGFTAATPVTYAAVASIADLAVSAESELFRPGDTFLTTGLGPIDLTRMVVSHNP